MKSYKPTTGVPQADKLIGDILVGDNIVWEANSGAPIDRFVSGFIAACERQKASVVYVSFNRSPQAIAGEYAGLMSEGRFTLVDCFSSGKGNRDSMFLDFFKGAPCPAIHVKETSDPAGLEAVLMELGARGCVGYVFDSLTGMLDLWGDEEKALRFFGHYCPRLFDLNTIAYWLLEKDAHSAPFLAKVRHITQVVLDVSVLQGMHTLTIRKASNRRCEYVGIPQQLILQDGTISVAVETREGRELGLLTRMGEVLGSALDPNSFFEQTMEALANELGMVRGTLVLLDKASNKLKIVAAHGLSDEEQSRGQYAIGEGITGQVVETGVAEIIPDIGKDGRFLNRTVARKRDTANPVAFICVPLKVDDEVVGALHDRKGRFEMAEGGTLFLDEIGEMSPRLQVKLLRVLQEREFEPVGSPRTVAVDARVVTATSKDLREEVRKGRFREDLYYRLNVIPIHLPPLRERREDIPLLINHFLEKFNRENHKNVRKLSRKVLDILLEYPWPGNVRELENCMERVVVMIEGDALAADLLPVEILDHDRQGCLKRKKPSATDLFDIRMAAERYCADTADLASARNLLLQTMEESVIRHGLLKKVSQRDLAVKLGISRMTLRKKMQAYDLK